MAKQTAQVQFAYREEEKHDVLTGHVNGLKVTCKFPKDPAKHKKAMQALKTFLLNS